MTNVTMLHSLDATDRWANFPGARAKARGSSFCKEASGVAARPGLSRGSVVGISITNTAPQTLTETPDYSLIKKYL